MRKKTKEIIVTKIKFFSGNDLDAIDSSFEEFFGGRETDIITASLSHAKKAINKVKVLDEMTLTVVYKEQVEIEIED